MEIGTWDRIHETAKYNVSQILPIILDGDGKKDHAPEGYRYFHTLQNHIRGIYRRERETHYNIHYRTRRERDEPLERHVGFAIKQVQQL